MKSDVRAASRMREKMRKWYEEVRKKWLFEYVPSGGMLQSTSREAHSKGSERPLAERQRQKLPASPARRKEQPDETPCIQVRAGGTFQRFQGPTLRPCGIDHSGPCECSPLCLLLACWSSPPGHPGFRSGWSS